MAWSISLKEKTAIAVFETLCKHFDYIPPPIEIHSDNGKEFVNELMNKLATMYNITVVTGEAYDPADQGKVERYNQTFTKGLSKFSICLFHYLSPRQNDGSSKFKTMARLLQSSDSHLQHHSKQSRVYSARGVSENLIIN
jgi:transposase InsO family protein